MFWLYKAADGRWVCVDADRASDDPIGEGVPQFRTVGNNVQDISEPTEALSWQYFDTALASWQGNMTFRTTRFSESSEPSISAQLFSFGESAEDTPTGVDSAIRASFLVIFARFKQTGGGELCWPPRASEMMRTISSVNYPSGRHALLLLIVCSRA